MIDGSINFPKLNKFSHSGAFQIIKILPKFSKLCVLMALMWPCSLDSVFLCENITCSRRLVLPLKYPRIPLKLPLKNPGKWQNKSYGHPVLVRSAKKCNPHPHQCRCIGICSCCCLHLSVQK